MASSSASSEYPNIPATSSPPPPSFVFPKRSFGSKKIVQRSCQRTWLGSGRGFTTVKEKTPCFAVSALMPSSRK